MTVPERATMTDEPTSLQLAEYEQLKGEQRQRMTTRDNMVYATFTALGASAAFGLSDQSHHIVLLVMPLVCYALGWTYLRNNHKIKAIGRYLSTLFISWETHRLHENGRRRRKVIQLSVDLIVFVVTGVVAVVLFWRTGQDNVATAVVSIGEVGLLTVLSVEFVLNSDILFKAPS